MSAPGSVTVLVIDDEPGVLRALARFVRAEGYRVVSTTNPADLEHLVGGEGVDVVLSDVDMPEINGLAVMAWLRRHHPRIVRLLISGRASLPAAMRAINEGEVFRFLTKPCQVDELRAVLAESAERARRGRAQLDPQELAERRDRLLEALEREHPGITGVTRTDGVYRLDLEEVARTIHRLDAPELAVIWEP